MRIKAADILLLFISVLLVLSALEVILRVFTPETIVTRYDPLLGWSLIPNATGHNKTPEYDTVERINAEGLRGPEYPYAKPAGARRVVVLGDSFTEGYTVNDEDLFTTRLSGLLKGRKPYPVDVINMGVAGYSTDQELLVFNSQGKKYAPDITVLMFYYRSVWYNNQDLYWRGCKPKFEVHGGQLSLIPVNDTACRTSSKGGVKAWLGTHSRLFGFVKDCVERNDVLTRWLISLHLKKVPDEFASWRMAPATATEEAWQMTRRLLIEFKSRAEEAGSAFVVFYIPTSSEIDDGIRQATMRRYGFSEQQWDPRETLRRLKSICAGEGISLIDPTAEFKKSGQRLYYVHDGHWNSQGNAFAARVLAQALTRILR